MSKASALEWVTRIRKILQDSEDAEKELSYITQCGSERLRKFSGSYYTPVDVSRYFWNEFFNLSNISSYTEALSFMRSYSFIEPSVGAGVLFFALLDKLAVLGFSPNQLAEIKVDLVDINMQSLEFVKEKVDELGKALGVKFSKVTCVYSDFQKTVYPKSSTLLFFFGNPPFVTNKKGTSGWKNLFADFLELALNAAGPNGAVHFILPISIAFSRDYRALRNKLHDHPRMIGLSHFDNIPDTLFKAGKPRHENTNKANSQRCSILTVIPSEKPKILSTKLHRWSKKERELILGRSPRYLDVTGYGFDDQIPRPKDDRLLHYLEQSRYAATLRDLLSPNGKYALSVASVARNYIGIREATEPGVHELLFERSDEFLKAFLLVTSDLFCDYWLTVGDGFHLTKANIYGFPVHDVLLQQLTAKLTTARRLWKNRKRYAKSKLNSGWETRSFDFSSAVPSLYTDLSVGAKKSTPVITSV